jgi:nucleoside-diphosphate-sugar epimerase
MRIVVTGGSGKAGRWVIGHLRSLGHDVLSVDVVRGGAEQGPAILADLTDLGQCLEVVASADAVVHLAAIPAPEIHPPAETFRNNTISTYNMFAAAVDRGVSRVVWASSETVLGLPFDEPPAYAPIDERHPPRPESSYALSKLVGETMAEQLSRQSGIPFIGFRISNIMEPHDYARFETWQDDPTIRKWNLWGYVDARDVAQAVARALEAEVTGAEVAIVAAADTCMRRPNADLLQAVFPDVPIRGDIDGRRTLLAIDHARDVLGYEPAYSWLDPASARDEGGPSVTT